MRRLDNRGFAVSVVLYASATIVVLVLILILSVLSTNNKNAIDLADLVKEQVSGVTGETYQLYNLVSNGSFENDGVSWTTDMNDINNTLKNRVDSTTFHSGGKSLLVSPSGWQFQKIQGVTAGDRLYVGFYSYIKSVSSGVVTVGLSYNAQKATGGQEAVAISPIEGSYSMNYGTSGFERGGAIAVVPGGSEVFVQLGASSTSNVNAYVDDVVVVNLTKAFGSGQEPSLDWCNSNIKYFNGVTIITNYNEDE